MISDDSKGVNMQFGSNRGLRNDHIRLCTVMVSIKEMDRKIFNCLMNKKIYIHVEDSQQ